MSRDYELEEEADRLLREACGEPETRRRQEYPWLTSEQLDRRKRRERPLEWCPAPSDADPETQTMAKLHGDEARQAINNLYRRAGVRQEERITLLLKLYDLSDEEIAFVLGVARCSVLRYRQRAQAKLEGLSAT